MTRYTPVTCHGATLWLKHDDAFDVGMGHRGGKARTCLQIAQAAKRRGATVLVTAGSRHSPQVGIVAQVASLLSMGCRVHVPAGEDSVEVQQAEALGATVVRHRPGYNTVIVARANEDAAEFGPDAVLVPFGMECQDAVQATAEQAGNLPMGLRRIVVPVGSGMSLAGVLTGLRAHHLQSVPVVGVVVGASPVRRLDRWAPPWWLLQATLVPAGVPYSTSVHHPAWPSWVPDDARVPLDPVYEAKVVPHLLPGDLLWIVGRRN